jgi:hypothetical protein
VAIDARSRPNQLMIAASSRCPPVVALRSGRPGKNERLHTIAGFTPSAIMSPGSRPVHPDKAGRHRASTYQATHVALGEVVVMR